MACVRTWLSTSLALAALAASVQGKNDRVELPAASGFLQSSSGAVVAPTREHATVVAQGGGSCTSALYQGPAQGAEACFCHKAHNAACVDLPCACREGCAGVEYQNAQTISFINLARTDCQGAMLTVPRAHIADMLDLKGECGSGASSLLTSMLMDGFKAYQTSVGSGPVMQCIHSASTVSVHWLHLHSFCPEGQVDGLPNAMNAHCSLMTSIADAGQIAEQFLQSSL
eukprot:CAMPEP_0203894658 /NCGR_PEP_ID=MMETSP0359-20131031/37587_1 /ASSEMBLY_ACC=CAM_ASM_000338 /TAXON_ID=268821 /ORGANISM="Scrippsiella Hangoei, Strain SHTV-5" /LENGTH=227 /DNA_ID=CAMNT_0050816999 /DNA_START=50 /DNA_END=733 /DNA_ORIENTATION=-